jgi:hypothetical protein
VGTAGVRLTQKENRERHVDEQHVFHRVVLFLAAITARLLSRILRALDASFGPIVPKRGRRVPALALSRADGTWSVTRPRGRVGLGHPIRWANAVKDRLGASASMRRVACSTTKRT